MVTPAAWDDPFCIITPPGDQREVVFKQYIHCIYYMDASRLFLII